MFEEQSDSWKKVFVLVTEVLGTDSLEEVKSAELDSIVQIEIRARLHGLGGLFAEIVTNLESFTSFDELLAALKAQ
jgi:hypothetical protein